MAGTGAEFVTTISATGPLFNGLAKREIQQALRGATQELVERGEGMVKAQLYPGHGLLFGTLRRSVAGEMRGLLSGLIYTNLIYGPWIEGVSRRNETTRFKGYAMFRRSAQALDKGAGRIVAQHVARARLG